MTNVLAEKAESVITKEWLTDGAFEGTYLESQISTSPSAVFAMSPRARRTTIKDNLVSLARRKDLLLDLVLIRRMI